MIKRIMSVLALGAVVPGTAVLGMVGTVPARGEPRAADVPINRLPADTFDLDYVESAGGGSLPITKASVSDVFENANRNATYGKDCTFETGEGGGYIPTKGAEPSVRWCFNSGDSDTPDWYPQGVTSDADADADESWGGHKGLMVSWYDTSDSEVDPGDDGIEKGVRVSVLNTKTKQYRHLLLVDPTGDRSYTAVTKDDGYSLHAGGIVWYGQYLYVADTRYGIRVFDLNNIYDLAADPNGDVEDETQVGQDPTQKTYHGFGYRYVVPQVGRWENAGSEGEACSPQGNRMNHSWLSLDRASTPNRLIAGEYCQEEAGPGRVAAWPLKDGKITNKGTSTEAFVMPYLAREKCKNNVQGGLKNREHWFFNTSCKGSTENGVMHRFRPISDEVWKSEGIKEGPAGPEDLTYRYRGDGNKRLLYTVSEHPGRRMIFARNTYDDYWVPKICNHGDGEPFAFKRDKKLAGLTCFEAKGDDQWVKDTQNDDHAFAARVRTDYGKRRKCVDNTEGWTECRYDHREKRCLYFRGGYSDSETEADFFGATRWLSTSTGNPGCDADVPKVCSPSDGEPYAFGSKGKLYSLTCFEANGDDQWVKSRGEDPKYTVEVSTDYGKKRTCSDDTKGWTECKYDHKEKACVRFKGNKSGGKVSPWVSTTTGNPGCKPD